MIFRRCAVETVRAVGQRPFAAPETAGPAQHVAARQQNQRPGTQKDRTGQRLPFVFLFVCLFVGLFVLPCCLSLFFLLLPQHRPNCTVSCTRFYLVLPGFTGFYWVLLGFTGFCRIF